MSVYGIGDFASQSIFPIAVGVGLVQNAERVTYAKIAKRKPHRKNWNLLVVTPKTN